MKSGTIVDFNRTFTDWCGQERSGAQDIRSNPGQVDQRVYRLEQIDEIKEAVQERIVAHLQGRMGTHHTGGHWLLGLAAGANLLAGGASDLGFLA